MPMVLTWLHGRSIRAPVLRLRTCSIPSPSAFASM